MPVGSAQTNKFPIGTAELRVGPLTDAGNLLQNQSVGLVDQATLNVNQESAQLLGGFPKKLVDSAITQQTAQITATLREFSRRNLEVLLGEGSQTQPTSFASTIDTIALAAAVTIDVPVGEGTNYAVGDIITTFPVGVPEKATVARIDSILTDALTLDAGTPVLYDLAAGDPIFLSRQIAIGNVSQTNYMAVTLIQKENATGNPLVFNFWKGSVASGLEYATNSDDFASTDLVLDLLEPAASEYAAAQPLNHLANIIPTHPVGFYAGG